MYSFSSLCRASSVSSFLPNYGGFKCFSRTSSSFLASSGFLQSLKGGFCSENVTRGDNAKHMLQYSRSLGMKLSLVPVEENVSSPQALSFRSFIHSGGCKDFEMGRDSRPMDFVRGIIDQDSSSREQNADFVHIKLMRNNTFVNVTDCKGNTKFSISAGSKEVEGLKSTRYAAEAIAEAAGRKAKLLGLKSVVVKVKGFTFFKKKRQAIMSFREGFSDTLSNENPIVYVEDTTRRRHNGCRLPRKRRN